MKQKFARCFFCDRIYCTEVDGQKLVYSSKVGHSHICLWCVERSRNFMELDKNIATPQSKQAVKDIMSKLDANCRCSFCDQSYDAFEAPSLRATISGSLVGRNNTRICPLCIHRYHLNITMLGPATLGDLFTKNVVRKLSDDCNLLDILEEVIRAATRENCSQRASARISNAHLAEFHRLTWMVDRHGESSVTTFIIDALSGKTEKELLQKYPQMTRDYYRKYRSKVQISEKSVDQAFSNHLAVGEHIARDQFWAELLKSERTNSREEL